MRTKTKTSRYLNPYWYRSQLLQIATRLRSEQTLVVLGAAHKTGTTWYGRIIKNILGLQMLPLSSELQGTRLAPDIEITEVLENTKIPVGAYLHRIHTLPPAQDFVQKYPQVKFLTITRDPRDVLVSAAFDFANRPESKGGWGPEFRNLSETERIIYLIEHGERLFSLLKGWGACSYAHPIRYEDLLCNGVSELSRITQALGYAVPTHIIRYYYQVNSFSQMSGREHGVEDKSSFLRKGIAGDWKNKFTPECLQAFKTFHQGEWQALLVELGYEKDINW